MRQPPDVVDFVIVGSGFGGSVAALRLTEKGYSVRVIEQGRRQPPEQLPNSTWQLRRWLWQPLVGWRGFFGLRFFRHMVVLHGNAVGGGSITYANTLLRAPDSVWNHGSWADLCDWTAVMPQHYRTAEAMLGVTTNRQLGEADHRLHAMAVAAGVGETFYPTRVGVYFGAEDEHSHAPINGDPYFQGKGPARSPCIGCGGCMVGCRYRAKNSLDYNYLYLAEQGGAMVQAETEVVGIRPLNDSDSNDGYAVQMRHRSGSLNTIQARAVVLAAGSLGTQQLLFRLREQAQLPHVSAALGRNVFTNAESLIGIRYPGSEVDLSRGIAIGSGIYLNPHTHIEATRYPAGSDSMGLLASLMPLHVRAGAWQGGAWLRQTLGWLCRSPKRAWQILNPKNFARESMIFLCMQTLNHPLHMRWRRPWYWPFRKRLHTTGAKIPANIPEAHAFTQAAAQQTGGVALAGLSELWFNVPMTAHCMGGAAMAADAQQGVCDAHQRVFGYHNLYVCDGSVLSANLGVNPSLTITALAEHAMSHIPARAESAWAAKTSKPVAEAASSTAHTEPDAQYPPQPVQAA